MQKKGHGWPSQQPPAGVPSSASAPSDQKQAGGGGGGAGSGGASSSSSSSSSAADHNHEAEDEDDFESEEDEDDGEDQFMEGAVDESEDIKPAQTEMVLYEKILDLREKLLDNKEILGMLLLFFVCAILV